jgi:hypothetical protein
VTNGAAGWVAQTTVYAYHSLLLLVLLLLLLLLL